MKRLQYTGGILAIMLCFTACKKDNEFIYSGPALAEFSNPPSNVNTKTIYTANVAVRDSGLLQLISAQVSGETKMTWDTTGLKNTAKAPDHIEFENAFGQLSIPPNSSHHRFYFSVKPAAAGKSFSMELNGGDAKPNENTKKMTFNFTAAGMDFNPTSRTFRPAVEANDTIRIAITQAAARFPVALTVKYKVNDSTATQPNQAVEGVDYEFITPKGEVQIAPKAGSGYFVIRWKPTATIKRIWLSLVPATGLNMNSRTFVYTVNAPL
ncbi:hypothetical protein [Chitinophaga deserti]|uniref:hypothetical protein n=1 Tax=Chitinophaga deserti TaxID=2164099 RepID=UPI000D6C5A32|nr:hypothetical protein [Chitinophaga deserti]